MTGNSDVPSSTTYCPIAGAPNRILYNFSSPVNRQEIDQTSIGTGGSYPTNIRFIFAGTQQAGDVASNCSTAGTRELLAATAPSCSTIGANTQGVFDPVFLKLMAPFNPIRVMKWSQIVTNPIANWSDRSLPCWVFWAEGNGGGTQINPPQSGIPFEVEIALANKLNADLWLNEPCLFTPSADTSLATLAHTILNSNLKVYVEPCNEWWNIGGGGIHGDGPIFLNGYPQGGAAFPCIAAPTPSEPCPSGTGSVSGAVLTITSGSLGTWEPGVLVKDVSAHTSTIIPGGTGTGGNGTYNLDNSTLTGTSFTGTNRGTIVQQWNAYIALTFVQSAQAWQTVWGVDYNRVYPIIGAQNGNPASGEFMMGIHDTDYGGLVCSGCSGNSWSGIAATQVKMADTAPYFPPGFTCPRAWTADVDGGLTRCFQQLMSGGLLETGMSPNTTTHTTDSLNACSVATGIAANHYSVVSGHSYGSLTNGIPVQLKFDVDTNGPCDDLRVDGLTFAQLQATNASSPDQDILIISGSITGTVLTVDSPASNGLSTCCTSAQIKIGSTVSNSGVSAGTFVTGDSSSGSTACAGSPCTGSGYNGTYRINNSQTVAACNPCIASFPAIANAAVTNGGSSGLTAPQIFVYTNATFAGSQPPSWRYQCNYIGCDDYAGGWIKQEVDFMAIDVGIITSAPYNLLWGGYEGGTTLDATSNGDETARLYVSMSRDTRFGTALTQYFTTMRSIGNMNGPFAYFVDMSGVPDDTGFHGFAWGLLEDSQETSSPKYDATVNYNLANPCWWANCSH